VANVIHATSPAGSLLLVLSMISLSLFVMGNGFTKVMLPWDRFSYYMPCCHVPEQLALTLTRILCAYFGIIVTIHLLRVVSTDFWANNSTLVKRRCEKSSM
jgi:hypothetical protein